MNIRNDLSPTREKARLHFEIEMFKVSQAN